ncbi:4-amino-4-deoxy-L-arabinose transferase-like glycosyltransferase [Frondihabitans sp. PhB188]|uniref:ArnT family glycosyltransferase n=1 Tax=Frondihabitans sp. PhB188 TaxID=2485200 RepID=UPI000F493EC8|nr:glycosyltransferase family 39 protein [Frondihabitans sp. PhB188]ROQ38339.1 4-amino-4-deoxy-L-arabinose transferase-like glycosyltransferase [Frondihabitans sp. PhB188]
MSTATLHRPSATAESAPAGSRARRAGRWLAFGPTTAPRWERPALWGLLVASGFLYIWNLAISGYANTFYSAAVQAGASNWEAFFFGSSDAANSITVDKPPASLWIMELSVRLFGLSSWSILLPEALMGVATVLLVYVIVRRHFSAATALIAGGVLMLTPVAVMMFRFNNPDAMLLLLMALAVYLTLRGIESGRLRWVVWAGVVVGFGFLTKQLQAFVILPELAAVYYLCAPKRWLARLGHLAAALGGVVVGAGWWVAIVSLWPADSRPYFGGSQTNSFLELTFGYNGFGRLTGDETGSVTGGTGTAGAGSWGATGITRLFGSEIGGQITWLLPAALIVMVAAFVAVGRRHRIDARRATLLLFSSWLVVTGLVFSFAGGIFHPYYTVALAAPLAGTLAIGGSILWKAGTAHWWPRVVLAVAMLVTAAWSYVLLARATDWLPWLKFVVVAACVAAAVLLLVPGVRRRDEVAVSAGSGSGGASSAATPAPAPGEYPAPVGQAPAGGIAPPTPPRVRGRALAASTLVLMLVGGLLGPLAYSLETASTAHTGSIPSAGPAVASSRGGFGGGGPGGGGNGGGFGGQRGTVGGGTGTAPGGFGGAGGTAPGATGGTGAGTGPTTGGFTGRGAGGFGGAGGIFGGTSTVSSALTKLLLADADTYTWVAATVGSDNAAKLQLATLHSVMPIGGFNGSDPSPTLAEFKADVAAGRIHYFIGGSVGTSNGGSDASSTIAAWVRSNFASQTVGADTVYDLTNPLTQ